MTDTRLIERWLPIAALSEESVRERRSMTALPPIYYLHVWWARRPLVASRAAVLASLLPENTDHDAFLHAIGIHGSPVETKRRIDIAKRTGEDLGADPYGYVRAFKYQPPKAEIDAILEHAERFNVLDPTSGGGSIPFEASRLGLNTYANDLNPVSATILEATINFPRAGGREILDTFTNLAAQMRKSVFPKFSGLYPNEPKGKVEGYLWARTVTCPYCQGLIPLSPNWKLAPGGKGIRLVPKCESGPSSEGRRCEFEIVDTEKAQSQGTIADGDATCPFPDCGRIVDGDEVKQQAQGGLMGDQLYAVAYKMRVAKLTKTGRPTEGWERGFRCPTAADDNAADLTDRFEGNLPNWVSLGVIPQEEIPQGSKTEEPHRYGMTKWSDLFSKRQIIAHCILTEAFREMFENDLKSGLVDENRQAAYVYLSFSLDKLLNYNARLTRWDNSTGRIRSVYDSHNLALVWSYAEMAILNEGGGFDWAIKQTQKCISELVELSSSASNNQGTLFADRNSDMHFSPTNISCKPGDNLDHIANGTIDAVVMDPPYGANVMYAELSDFFYVWLKRTAGLVMPQLFTRYLTNKDVEAVANRAHFKGQKGADALANRDYQDKMASIFAECRRVLKPNGIMTVMFTHKDSGAWDALTKSLIVAEFMITASWPINTESEASLHIKNKAAANSTIFLVCRPRPVQNGTAVTYWEDVEPQVTKAVRTRVEEFQKAGIAGVDLYLASFGPALEEFSRHWPLKRGTPRPETITKKRRKQAELFEEEFDPYAVTPEDALDAARREVKTWRLNQLTHAKGRADLDASSSWFVLAWDAFKAPVFAYDEGLRLARAVGADLDSMIGRLCEKKGSDLKLWDSATRAAKGALGPADGSRGMIDVLHHVAHKAHEYSLEAALQFLKDQRLDSDPAFLNAFEAVLEVLPPSKAFLGFDVASGDAKAASDDFDALEKLRRLAFSEKIDQPKQLDLFAQEVEAAA
jgi:putative DNA methylase